VSVDRLEAVYLKPVAQPFSQFVCDSHFVLFIYMVVLTRKHLAHVAHVAPMLRVGWATWVGCFPLSLSYYARELAQAPLPLGSHTVEQVFALTAHPSARPCRVKLELHVWQFLSAYSAFHNQFISGS
jgi:hypothetical protein